MFLRFLKNKKFTIILVLVVLVVIGYIGYKWYEGRMFWVRQGLASDKFPFRMYTERELVEMGRWPVESQELINTPTTIRPEETFKKFKQALIDGDMDKAAECFIKEKREEWRKSLYEIKKKGFLKDILNDLPEKLEDTYFYTDDITGKDTKSRDLDHIARSSYIYVMKDDPERIAQTMTFVKNWDGVWLIEDL